MINNINQHNLPSIEAESEFIDLSQIWATIKSQWLTILSCILLASIAAIVLWSSMPAKWQATTTIQIGQMPSNTVSKDFISPTLVEPAAQAAARLDQRELKNTALAKLDLPLDDETNKHSLLFRTSLKANTVKNTDFIQINLKAYSPEEAKKNLTAAAQVLIDMHNQRMAPVLANIEQRIKSNAQQMIEAQAEFTDLKGTLRNGGQPRSDGQFIPRVYVAELIHQQNSKIKDLEKERNALTDSTLTSNTYPTSIIDAIFVPVKPFFPKLSVFLALGLFIGAALGLGLALIKSNRAKQSTL